MMARDNTVLPEPDSPTMPRVLPWSRVNETPWTACSWPRLVANETCRSSTSRRVGRAWEASAWVTT